MAAFNARERRARQIVAGLAPQSGAVGQTASGDSRTPTLVTPSLKVTTTTDSPDSRPGPSSGGSQTLSEQPPPKVTTRTDTAESCSAPQKLRKEKNLPLPTKQYDYSNLMDPAELTDMQRQCFSLRHEYQLPVTEIARRLGRDRTTIQEHIDNAETLDGICISRGSPDPSRDSPRRTTGGRRLQPRRGRENSTGPESCPPAPVEDLMVVAKITRCRAPRILLDTTSGPCQPRKCTKATLDKPSTILPATTAHRIRAPISPRESESRVRPRQSRERRLRGPGWSPAFLGWALRDSASRRGCEWTAGRPGWRD